jgi:hypothetical protein
MSTPVRTADRGPTLGAMFRLIHSALVQEYTAWLASSNYRDVKPAHAAVLQPLWQNPDGERLTTLADTGEHHKTVSRCAGGSSRARGLCRANPRSGRSPGDSHTPDGTRAQLWA